MSKLKEAILAANKEFEGKSEEDIRENTVFTVFGLMEIPLVRRE